MSGNLSLPFKKRKFDFTAEEMEIDGSHTSEPMEVNVSNMDEEEENELSLSTNLKRKQPRMQSCSVSNDFVELENAFRGILKTFYLKNDSDLIKDICLLLVQSKQKMNDVIRTHLKSYGALKFNIVLECTYVRPLTNEKEARAYKTRNHAVFQSSPLDVLLNHMIGKICNEESEYESKGSGWALFSVDGILLRLSRYRPLGGSTYIPLPEPIAAKRAVINPQNTNDNKCFQWALLSKYVHGKHRYRIDQKYLSLVNKFNFKNISFPTPLKQIGKFEKNNPDVSINVYGLNDKYDVFPLRVCKEENKHHFDLLLISNTEGVHHFCYISNFSRLIRNQKTQCTKQLSVCKRCFKHYQGKDSERKLAVHKKDCIPNKPVRVSMPEAGRAVLKFKDYHFKDRIPIAVYCDFECILEKVNEKQSKFTEINENHKPMSFCVFPVCDRSLLPENVWNRLPVEPYLHRGPDAAAKFMTYIIALTNKIGDLLKKYVPMAELTDEETRRLRTATHCELCNTTFSLMTPPQADHCHLTGRFRNVLCFKCNIKRTNQKFLPVFIHGSSNYDSHFIVRQLGCDKRKIEVIPNSKEKYISFSKKTSSDLTIRFLDSYRFLNTSLDVLVNNLPKEKFRQTKQVFPCDDKFSLVCRKGVYPYEFTDSWEKLEIQQLPPKERFYNALTETTVSDEDYNHALAVWAKFNCSTLGEYSDHYLRTDVLLLSDVVENFRDICISDYEIDPAYYLTLPSFTFAAMLKYTKVELELFDCYDKHLFVERGIRGGITLCSKRNAKANNPLLGKMYDSNLPTSYLAYLDANNLYGFAMAKPMPINNFQWLSKSQVKKFDVLNCSFDSPVGYFIECSVGYPTYLHDKHNDFPFLAENKNPPTSKHKKLLTTLESKDRYVCHGMTLKQALQNGLVLTRIHRVMSFNQSAWLKPYIDFNTEKRKQAKNDFEKDLYKLLNNSMFGKTIENIRKRSKIDLVNSEKKLNRLLSKPNFKNRIVYDDNLCAVECSQESVYFNKPIYIGFTVLEFSKYHMYDFHYNVIKPYYGNNVNVLYGDTDSFFYEIFTNNIYEDFMSQELKLKMDMSDYPATHQCYDVSNKKVLGCFKDECAGVPIVEFIGLRPKLYTYTTVDDDFLQSKKGLVMKKAKGITKPVVKNKITFQDFKNVLLNRDLVIRKGIRVFRSKKHQVQTVTVNKIALSGNDDKRHICEDGINTLAYGHYRLSV